MTLLKKNTTERTNKFIQRLHLSDRYDSYWYNSQIFTGEIVQNFITKKMLS